jgi:two-component system, OmpR family, sensor kinase
MTYNTERTGFWAAVKAAPGRMSLRLKLVTAVLLLVGLALAVTTLVGNVILKNYLLSPYDNGLRQDQAVPPGSQTSAAEQFVASFLDGGNPITRQSLALDFVSRGRVDHVIQPASGFGGYSGPGGGFKQLAVLPGPALQTKPAWLVERSGHPITLPAETGPGEWRVLMKSAQFESASGTLITGTIVVAVDVTSVYQTTGQLASIDLIVGLVVLALLGLIGVVVVRSSLRPLKEIEATAGAIAAGDLTRRVPARDPATEVGSLGRSLNVMLSQIETAFDAQSESEDSARRSEERMRQFVADASHELRTPLTAIRGFAEYYRQRGGMRSALDAEAAANDRLSAKELDQIMRRVEQESARMGVLVEDMLMLARLDQQRPLDRNTVDLLTLAADAVHDARVIAPDRQINLTVGSGAALLVKGDEVRLRQVIGNLMSNARSHTPAGTAIDVTLRAGMMAEIQGATATPTPVVPGASGVPVGPAAVLEVTDHGEGLSAEQAQHAFERFYTADRARTTGGTGLGLAIVAALVAAHGGEVWVRTQPGQGATFAIALPLAPEAVQHPGQDDEPDEIDPAEIDPEVKADETSRSALREDGDWVDLHGGRRAGGNAG